MIEDVELRNYALAIALGASPATRNIDRILRVPGTINYPNRVKRKRGRKPCWAKWLEVNDVAYPLSEFPRWSEPETEQPTTDAGADTELPPLLQALLHIPNPETGAYQSRSELMFAFLCDGIRRGLSDQVILDACMDRQFAGMSIYEHVRENKGLAYAKRQLRQAKAKVPQQQINEAELRPLTTRTLDLFTSREIEWLWWPFVPLREVTLLFGDGGVGKSSVIVDMAARVGAGRAWPRFGDEPEERAQSGSVLLMTKEDDPQSVIRPRLEAAGASDAILKRVHLVGYDDPDDPTQFDALDRLDTNMARLEGKIMEIGDVKLVAIDAATDFTGKLDVYRDDHIRALVLPLARIARRYGLAVIIVVHVNKKEDLVAARNRALGGVAFVNVPRSAVVVGKDPDDDHRKIMSQCKYNLTRDQHTVAFTTVTVRAWHRIEWEADWVTTLNADDLLQSKTRKPKLTPAKEAIQGWLADGAVRASEIYERALALGLSKRTVDTAKKELGVISKKVQNVWMWSLPAGVSEEVLMREGCKMFVIVPGGGEILQPSQLCR